MGLQGASDECIFHRGARGYSVAYAKGRRLHLPVKQRFTAELITWVRIPPCAKAYRQEVLELPHQRRKKMRVQKHPLQAISALTKDAISRQRGATQSAISFQPCLKTDTVTNENAAKMLSPQYDRPTQIISRKIGMSDRNDFNTFKEEYIL